ncbi:MAG TPA: bacillithiol system redox-active protein YtxJ [Chitinophagales bacterium]|nr:bacillithiol system redox-active protein YtxJ [Chitinophagales bacterium]
MNWITLNSEQQLKDLLASQDIIVVFKHSTRCSISSMVKNRVEREWTSDHAVYYLDLIAHRNVSNLIAQLSGVEHQSPQMIVFKEGKPIYDASHTSISASEVMDLL